MIFIKSNKYESDLLYIYGCSSRGNEVIDYLIEHTKAVHKGAFIGDDPDKIYYTNKGIVKSCNKDTETASVIEEVGVRLELPIIKPTSWTDYIKYYPIIPITKIPALEALNKLRALHDVWVSNCNLNCCAYTHNIVNTMYGIVIEESHCKRPLLSFPTKQTALNFMNCFEKLIEQAKIFL